MQAYTVPEVQASTGSETSAATPRGPILTNILTNVATTVVGKIIG